MKVILIHGIGDHHPGWANTPWVAMKLGVNPSDISEVTYEDLLQRSWINKTLIFAAQLALQDKSPKLAELAAADGMPPDYLNDLLVYFFGWKTREKIIERVLDQLPDDGNAVVIGHSLGSVVAFDALRETEVPVQRLYTLGSPLSKFVVRKLRGAKREGGMLVAHWVNIYGPWKPAKGKGDPIGGKVVEADRNIELPGLGGHGFGEYIALAGKWFAG